MERAEEHSRLYWAVLIGFLYWTFVGTYPLMGESGSVATDPLNRVMLIAVLLLSLLLVWLERHNVMRCIGRAPVQLAIVAICCTSIVWSQYPFITLKRAAVLAFITVIALAVAAGTKDLRAFHTVLFGTMTTIVVANSLFTLIFPSSGISIDPYGVRGFYMEKNAAGATALIALTATGTWLAGTVRLRDRCIGIAALIICFAFLFATRSKTSIAIGVLSLSVFYTFVVAQHVGDAIPRFVLTAGFALAAVGVSGLLFIDFEISTLFAAIFGDTGFTGRDELWAYVYKMASTRPILGFGYGAFWDVGLSNDPLNRLEPGTWLGDVAPGVINQAHNGYLELWLQMGLPVMILAVGVVLATIFSATRVAISGIGSSQAAVAFGMVAIMLVVYLLHNSMEASLMIREQPFFNLALLLIFLATRGSTQWTSVRYGANQ